MKKGQRMSVDARSADGIRCYATDVPVSNDYLGISLEDLVCKLWKSVDN